MGFAGSLYGVGVGFGVFVGLSVGVYFGTARMDFEVSDTLVPSMLRIL